MFKLTKSTLSVPAQIAATLGWIFIPAGILIYFEMNPEVFHSLAALVIVGFIGFVVIGFTTMFIPQVMSPFVLPIYLVSAIYRRVRRVFTRFGKKK